MRFRPRRFTAGICLLLAVPFVLGALHLGAPPAVKPEPTAFESGPANISAWAGDASSRYQLRATVSGLYLVDEGTNPTTSLLVVYSPTRAPTAAEAERLQQHLQGGGALWILDALGVYNEWLAAYGVSVGPHRLIDSTPADTPGIVRLNGGDSLGDFGNVVARSPATLVLQDPALWKPWLSGPPSTHLDLTSNGTVDRIDPPGPHTVGAARALSPRGFLIVTADASLLSNAMRETEQAENAEFAAWVLRQALPAGGLLLVDESQNGWTTAERLPVAAIGKVQRLHDAPATLSILLLTLLTGLAFVIGMAAQPLRPYLPHRRSDPVSAPLATSSPELIQEVAWELLARQTRQPLHRLKEAGAAAAADGLADDPILRRVLLGKSDPHDDAELLRTFLSTNKLQTSSRGNL